MRKGKYSWNWADRHWLTSAIAMQLQIPHRRRRCQEQCRAMPYGSRGDRHQDPVLRSLVLRVATEPDYYTRLASRTHYYRVPPLATVYFRNDRAAQRCDFEHWSRALDWLQRRQIPRTETGIQNVHMYATLSRGCAWPLRYTDGSCWRYSRIEPEVFAQDLLA